MTYPTMMIEVRVTNFAKLRGVIEQLASSSYYRGIFRDYISEQLKIARNFAEIITHKATGTLAASHRWEYDSHAMRGRLYIDRRMAYARGSTVQWPFIYGVYEHGRGGTHAFYERTYHQMLSMHQDYGLKAQVVRTLIR